MAGCVTGPVRVCILVLVASLVAGALPAAGATQAPIELEVQPELRMNQTMLFIGHVSLGGPELADPGAVTVDHLTLPAGTLYACPQEGGQRDEVPPFPVLERRCRGEESFEDPELRFGRRTWLAFGGNHTLAKEANASMTLLTRDGDQPGPLLVGQLISDDGVRLGLDEGRLAFTPLLGSSEVTVDTGDRARQYNGSDWVFYFEGSQDGQVGLVAEGLYAGLRDPVDLDVRETDVDALETVLEPRRLLDLQDAAIGADAREPVDNATALFADRGRVPDLVNGALLGHANGTLGGRELDPETVTTVRVDSLTAQADPQGITGQASVLYRAQGGAISAGLEDPAGVPWVVIAVLVVVAGLAWLAGWDPATTGARERWGLRGLAVGGLLVWDLRFGSVTGTSALSTLGDGWDLGVFLALLGFELIAAGLAAVAFYAPASVGLRRGLPPSLNRWGRLGAATVWVLVLVLFPALVIAMGQLVARL